MKLPDISVIVDGSLLYKVNVTVREYVSDINDAKRKRALSLCLWVAVFKWRLGEVERRVQSPRLIVLLWSEWVHGFLLIVRFFA